MFTPRTITLPKLIKFLKEQNPQKTQADFDKLLENCFKARMDAWEIHGFMVSGYAKNWNYNLDDE